MNRESPAARWAMHMIRWYQQEISPRRGPCCRYVPTCSQYTLEAIRLHGFIYGCLLGAWRVLRCNPFSRGGYDPVPGTKTSHSE